MQGGACAGVGRKSAAHSAVLPWPQSQIVCGMKVGFQFPVKSTGPGRGVKNWRNALRFSALRLLVFGSSIVPSGILTRITSH
jgi:hypothetical protein